MGRPKKMSLADALRILRAVTRSFGMPPTILEYREALGVGSSRTVLRYLAGLEAAGLIQRFPGARGIRLTDAVTALLGPEASFADLLKAGRLAARLSLRDAEAASGISNAYISQLETGREKNPTARVLWRLATLYELNPATLLQRLCEEAAS